MKPCIGLWAVVGPGEEPNFTTVSMRPDYAIEIFMKQEWAVTRLMRSTPCQSWEGYEADGYSVQKVDLVPSQQEREEVRG